MADLDALVTTKLREDYLEGLLTTDEYVRYNLYAEYNDLELLGEKDSSLGKNMSSNHVEKLVEKYFDELSDDTLAYYYDKLMLKEVTFEIGKENEEINTQASITDIFMPKVYAADNESVANLYRIVVSPKKKFVVWYTTTGKHASSKEMATKIAESLENTIEQYDELFGSTYKADITILSKSNYSIYNQQKAVLEYWGESGNLLETAMQVYLLDFGEPLAEYRGTNHVLRRLFIERYGDENNAIVTPYILIRPSAVSDFETLEQVYNHEMMHHYQYQVLSNDGEKEMLDEYAGEATANWASAQISNKTSDIGFLNDWSASAIRNSNSLLSDEWIEKYGKTELGYGLFLYLCNYQNNVSNGKSKILEALYSDDFLKTLELSVDDLSTLNKIEKDMILNSFTRDYDNKNLLPSPDFYEDELIKMEHKIDISKEESFAQEIQILNPTGIQYYEIIPTENAIKIEFTRECETIVAYLIGEKNGEYTVLDSFDTGYDESHEFYNNINIYDKYYLAVGNSSLMNNRKYAFTIIRQDIVGEEIEAEKTDASEKNYISLIRQTSTLYYEGYEVAGTSHSEIHTYYFDKEGNASREIITYMYETEEDAENWHDTFSKNVETFKWVKKNGKTVIGEYTEEYRSKGDYETIKHMGENPGLGMGEPIDFEPDI